ncbi:RNA-binding protein [Gracilaria domingensis]|nr:RNA-binding protein [Gracilaria domingensis]
MASSSADFVLDEGLDEDEDVLVFQSGQHYTEPEASTTNAQDAIPEPHQQSFSSADNDPSFPAPVAPTSVIIDGLPISSSRADLDALLDSSPITNVRLRRLEKDGLLRVRVQFSDSIAAAAALSKDGADFRGSVIAVKVATDERWEASNAEQKLRHVQQPPKKMFPDAKEVQSGFWNAFAAAKNVAERLEKGARHISEDLERRLHVSEKVEQTKNAIADLDEQYGVSRTVSDVARKGKEAAEDVDKTYGISNGVNKVASNVSGAAGVVAREVDESFRVSDRARGVFNDAIKNDAVGDVAKGVVGALEGDAPTGKKRTQPTADEREEVPSTEQSSSANFEVGG